MAMVNSYADWLCLVSNADNNGSQVSPREETWKA